MQKSFTLSDYFADHHDRFQATVRDGVPGKLERDLLGKPPGWRYQDDLPSLIFALQPGANIQEKPFAFRTIFKPTAIWRIYDHQTGAVGQIFGLDIKEILMRNPDVVGERVMGQALFQAITCSWIYVRGVDLRRYLAAVGF